MKKHFVPQNKNHLIAQSRQLVEARYNFTLWEMRLFVEVLEQIKKEDTKLREYRVYYKDLIREYGEHKQDYKYIRDASIRLLRKVAHFEYVNEEGQERVYHAVLFTGADTPRNWQEKDENMFIDFSINDKLKEQLIQLKSNYLLYDKRHVLRLKSKFSVRIYQLLKSHEREAKDTVIVEYKIKELREMLLVDENGNPNNQYSKHSMFKKRVLLQAQKELKEHTDISFSFDEIKKGRRVDIIRFFVKKNRKKGKKKESKQLDLELQKPPINPQKTTVKAQKSQAKRSQKSPEPTYIAPQPAPPIVPKTTGFDHSIHNNPVYQQLMNIGILQYKVVEITQKYEANFVLETIKRANKAHQKVPKKNLQGFIINCIEKGTYQATIEQEKQKKLKRKQQAQIRADKDLFHNKILVNKKNFEAQKKAKIEELKKQITEQEKKEIIAWVRKTYHIVVGNQLEASLLTNTHFDSGIEAYYEGTDKLSRTEIDFIYHMEKIYGIKCAYNFAISKYERI